MCARYNLNGVSCCIRHAATIFLSLRLIHDVLCLHSALFTFDVKSQCGTFLINIKSHRRTHNERQVNFVMTSRKTAKYRYVVFGQILTKHRLNVLIIQVGAAISKFTQYDTPAT